MKKDSKNTKIVSIISGKGGVGKSVLTANMGYILASMGYKVVLIDGSIALSNLDIILRTNSKKNLLDFLSLKASLEDITIQVDENLSLIPGESGSEILNFPPDEISKKLFKSDNFFDNFDFVLIDNSSGLSEYMKSFIKYSDEIIVITQTEPTSITDAYTLIKIVSKTDENLSLIVNKTDNENEAQFIYEKLYKVVLSNISTSININYLGYIENSKILLSSLKNRELFAKKYPNSMVSNQLEDIVNNLLIKFGHKIDKPKKKHQLTMILKKFLDKI